MESRVLASTSGLFSISLNRVSNAGRSNNTLATLSSTLRRLADIIRAIIGTNRYIKYGEKGYYIYNKNTLYKNLYRILDKEIRSRLSINLIVTILNILIKLPIEKE